MKHNETDKARQTMASRHVAEEMRSTGATHHGDLLPTNCYGDLGPNSTQPHEHRTARKLTHSRTKPTTNEATAHAQNDLCL